ncbi:TetR family transcriptional regulator [Halanaerobacter jeridensis]|uniref:AcrR family transcriptional regulator n=1 Tax=Halanaerobacter jeridensis TaxID=706427 RepID=A0A938XUU2_9FIRM|nr:AcrR family transcriptional regulator [Halanaerobacter jeridensis]
MIIINSKDRILDVALQLFIRNGYRGTSLNDIADQAGLTKGGVYHYFSSKDDLYYQAVKRFFDFSQPGWLDNTDVEIKELIWQGFQSIKDRKKWIKDLVGVDSNDAILHFYMFLYDATRRYPELQKDIDQHDEAKRKKLAKVFRQAQQEGKIREDVNPEVIAFELDALLQQLEYLSFVNPNIYQDSNMYQRLFDNYWLRLKK